MSENLKKKAISGVIWSSLDRFSVQGVQFIITIIIARILSPSDFGLIGMLAIFLAISQTFVDSGFSNALIRKYDRTETDFSTVFYFNIVIGLVCYFVLFFASPLIAKFYNKPELESITKVIGLVLIFNSLIVVQRAKLVIEIDFKTQTKSSIIAVVISGVFGVGMAYYGYGVWALVFQSIIFSVISMVLLWYYSKWIPMKVFSYRSFKTMFSFGSKLLASSLIDTIYNNVYSIVIGKKFSADDLGYYTRASSIAQYPSLNITSILGRVIFPILSRIQNDDLRLQSVYRKYLRLSAFIVFPLMIGLAVLAKPLIILLLTHKWEGAILLLQLICLSYMLYPIHAINLNLLQVKGRSGLFLKLEIIKKAIGVLILCISIPLGVPAMCIGGIITSYICLAINMYYTGKLIHLDFFKQMRDLIPIFAYSFSMGLIILIVNYYISLYILQLLIGIILGIGYYFFIAWITKSMELKELILIVKNIKK